MYLLIQLVSVKSLSGTLNLHPNMYLLIPFINASMLYDEIFTSQHVSINSTLDVSRPYSWIRFTSQHVSINSIKSVALNSLFFRFTSQHVSINSNSNLPLLSKPLQFTSQHVSINSCVCHPSCTAGK